MGDEHSNPGELFPPAKRYRPFVGDTDGASSTKLCFTFIPAASASAECRPDKEIFTKVQDVQVPLFRDKSVGSDVSMAAEEMDVDI
jgi:hypothetical protein